MLRTISHIAVAYADKVPEGDREDSWALDASVVDVDLVVFACVRAFWEQSDVDVVATRTMYTSFDTDGNGVLSFEVRCCYC